MTQQEIDAILVPWTAEMYEAAAREGWDLAQLGDELQIQRIDNPEDLPSGIATFLPDDDTAMAMVRCGTGAHHALARQIIHDNFPTEWANMEAAYATFHARSFK